MLTVFITYQNSEHILWSDPTQLFTQSYSYWPQESVRAYISEITCKIHSSHPDFPLGSHHSTLQHKALIYPLDSRWKQAHPKDQGTGLQDFLSSHQLLTAHTRSVCPELWVSRWLCNTLKQKLLTCNLRASFYCRGTTSDLTFTVSHLC